MTLPHQGNVHALNGSGPKNAKANVSASYSGIFETIFKDSRYRGISPLHLDKVIGDSAYLSASVPLGYTSKIVHKIIASFQYIVKNCGTHLSKDVQKSYP